MSIEQLFEFIDDQVGLQLASIALLGLAVIPIYTGSFASLTALKRPATSRLRRRSVSVHPSPFDDSDDEGEEKAQVLSLKDILYIPVVASGALYSLHLALKEISPHCVNQAIQIIAAIFSCAVFSNTAVLVIRSITPEACLSKFAKYKFTFSKQNKSKIKKFIR